MNSRLEHGKTSLHARIFRLIFKDVDRFGTARNFIYCDAANLFGDGKTKDCASTCITSNKARKSNHTTPVLLLPSKSKSKFSFHRTV